MNLFILEPMVSQSRRCRAGQGPRRGLQSSFTLDAHSDSEGSKT